MGGARFASQSRQPAGTVRVPVLYVSAAASNTSSSEGMHGTVEDGRGWWAAGVADVLRDLAENVEAPLRIPGRPAASSAAACSAYRGCRSTSLTSVFSNNGKPTPYVVAQDAAISSAVPGSWPANWWLGKPSTLQPRSAWRSCSRSSPECCGAARTWPPRLPPVGPGRGSRRAMRAHRSGCVAGCRTGSRSCSSERGADRDRQHRFPQRRRPRSSPVRGPARQGAGACRGTAQPATGGRLSAGRSTVCAIVRIPAIFGCTPSPLS